jgi:hypothetical protein
MPVVSCDCPRFSGLAWTCNLLPTKHTQARIYYARPFGVHFIASYSVGLHQGLNEVVSP